MEGLEIVSLEVIAPKADERADNRIEVLGAPRPAPNISVTLAPVRAGGTTARTAPAVTGPLAGKELAGTDRATRVPGGPRGPGGPTGRSQDRGAGRGRRSPVSADGNGPARPARPTVSPRRGRAPAGSPSPVGAATAPRRAATASAGRRSPPPTAMPCWPRSAQSSCRWPSSCSRRDPRRPPGHRRRAEDRRGRFDQRRSHPRHRRGAAAGRQPGHVEGPGHVRPGPGQGASAARAASRRRRSRTVTLDDEGKQMARGLRARSTSG